MDIKMRCLAIDDEPLALQQISSYIKKTPFLEEVCLCHTAFEAIECLEKNGIDLMFVDINMPDINGLEFVRSLPVKPFVVYTTAYSEYGYEGFLTDAIDYILKPLSYPIFLKAVSKAKNLYDLTHRRTSENTSSESKEIFVKSEYKIVRINPDDIEYIESANEYIKIFLGNDQFITTFLRLKNFMEQLPEDHFMRIHRSFIVHLKKIISLERNRVMLHSGKYIPVGEQYKETFHDYIEKKFIK